MLDLATMTIKEKAALIATLTREVISEATSAEFAARSETNHLTHNVLHIAGGEFVNKAEDLNQWIANTD